MAFPARVVAAEAPKYIKGYVDLAVRERPFFNKMQKNGRFMFNQKGRSYEWRVYATEPTVTTHTIGGTISYAPNQPYKIASLEPQFGKASDAMHTIEQMITGGGEAIIRHYAEIVPQLTRSMMNWLNEGVYIDGYANSGRMHGYNSFTGTGTTAAGDIIAQPDDSYANIDTDVGALSSVWDDTLTTQPNSTISTDWPDGNGSSGYDYWSPRIFNYSSTGWGTGSTAWQDNCETVLRRAKQWATVGSGPDGTPTDVFMTATMYAQLLDHFAVRNRTPLPTGKMDSGYPEGLNFEGLTLWADFDCPAGEAYLFNWRRLKFMCPEAKIIVSKGPIYDPHADSALFNVIAPGNFIFESPKFFAKLDNVA